MCSFHSQIVDDVLTWISRIDDVFAEIVDDVLALLANQRRFRESDIFVLADEIINDIFVRG